MLPQAVELREGGGEAGVGFKEIGSWVVVLRAVPDRQGTFGKCPEPRALHRRAVWSQAAGGGGPAR